MSRRSRETGVFTTKTRQSEHQTIAVSEKKQNLILQVKEFSGFSVHGKSQESGLIGVFPLMHLALQGPHPAGSHPESPQGAPLRVAAVSFAY